MDLALRVEIEQTWEEVFTEEKMKEYFENKYVMRESSVGSAQSYTMVDKDRKGRCLFTISKTFYEMKMPAFKVPEDHHDDDDNSVIRVEISKPKKYTLEELVCNNRKYVEQLEIENQKTLKNAKKGIPTCKSNRGDSPPKTQFKEIKKTANSKVDIKKATGSTPHYGSSLMPEANVTKERSVSKGRNKSNDKPSNTGARKSVDPKSFRFK
jgi:hypothetical protein